MCAGSRLDAFLAEALPGVSRRYAREACRSGLIMVNGHRANAGSAVRKKDEIHVRAIERKSDARYFEVPKDDSLHICWEDEALLIVNKPRAMHCVTQRESDARTLADLIVSYDSRCREASNNAGEAGLVQRLDYYTSGLLIVAKTRNTWQQLRESLNESQIEKSYRCVVQGVLRGAHTIDSAIESSGQKRMKIATSHTAAKKHLEAKTCVEPLHVIENAATLVRALAHRARRHQVRLHLASHGHPLVGDELYGATEKVNTLDSNIKTGFLLHAESIAFTHPLTDEAMRFSDSGEAVSPLFSD